MCLTILTIVWFLIFNYKKKKKNADQITEVLTLQYNGRIEKKCYYKSVVDSRIVDIT